METWDDLEQLYLRHSRSVFRRARELLADDEAARDATHEVFMRVVRAGGKVPAEPTCTGWLHRVTTNLCLNQLRDRSRQSNLLSVKHVPDNYNCLGQISGSTNPVNPQNVELILQPSHDFPDVRPCRASHGP